MNPVVKEKWYREGEKMRTRDEVEIVRERVRSFGLPSATPST